MIHAAVGAMGSCRLQLRVMTGGHPHRCAKLFGDDEGGGGDAAANPGDEYGFAGLETSARYQRPVRRH
jgi:hypothetical protein